MAADNKSYSRELNFVFIFVQKVLKSDFCDKPSLLVLKL